MCENQRARVKTNARESYLEQTTTRFCEMSKQEEGWFKTPGRQNLSPGKVIESNGKASAAECVCVCVCVCARVYKHVGGRNQISSVQHSVSAGLFQNTNNHPPVCVLT